MSIPEFDLGFGPMHSLQILKAAIAETALTLNSPIIQGTVDPGTGLTMPAFISSGNITLSYGIEIQSNGDADSIKLWGGATEAHSAMLELSGSARGGATGRLWIGTPNAGATACLARLVISGVLATAVATWSAVTHTGIVLTASEKINPVSGVAGFSVVSTSLTLGSAGSVIAPYANMVGAADDAARDVLAGNVDGAIAIDTAGGFICYRRNGLWYKAAGIAMV